NRFKDRLAGRHRLAPDVPEPHAGRRVPHECLALDAETMSRQDANAAFARTSFLYGGNAAYIEDLHARFQADPASVDAEWQEFFKPWKYDASVIAKNAKGASWQKPNWPQKPNSDLVATPDGQWAETE